MFLPLDLEDEPILCIGCGEPALAKCKTEAGRREVSITKLCEPCFFEWCGVDPEDHLPSHDDESEDTEDVTPKRSGPIRIPPPLTAIN